MTHSQDSTPANPAQVTDAKELADRITDYLTDGGLFNPEMMPHGPARDLLIDCRSALTAAIGAGRSSEPEFETAPDNGTPAEVLAYVLECARRWVPEARIIGNARAGDIERAIAAIGAGGQAVASEVLDVRYLLDDNGEPLEVGGGDVLAVVKGIPNDPVLAFTAAWNSCRAAAIAHPAQPGWRLVPMTPTQEMMDAADRARPLPESYVYEIYGAMLSAAPQPKGE